MNWNNKSLFLLICFVFTAFSLFSQKSSKSKASDKLYEKGKITANVLIKNARLINTDALEFSPVFYENGIVYVTSRYKNGPVDKKIGETFFDLFYADTDMNGMPLDPEDFSIQINSQVHEGPVSFSRAGDRIYFTRNNLDRGLTRADTKGKIGMKIYEAYKGKFDWENVKELPFNNDEYSCVHPSLSPDGNLLYFASNMRGGHGGMDLYVVERKGDTWSKPINLGPKINTTKNEIFPFIYSKGVLFFASNGHQGYGGLDIFLTDLKAKDSNAIINLGSPFNTGNDDLGLILNREGTMGFFTSDREGGLGKDDIYQFEAPEGIMSVQPTPSVSTLISVMDAKNKEKISGAAIRIFERTKDGFVGNEDYYNLQLLPTTYDAEELTLKLIRKKEEELGQPKFISDDKGEAITAFQDDKQYILLISKEGYVTSEKLYSTIDKVNPQIVEVELIPSSCLSLNGVVTVEGYNSRVPNANIRILNQCDNSEEIIQANINGEFEYCLEKGCEFTLTGKKVGYNSNSSSVSTVKIRGSRSISAELKLTPSSVTLLNEPIREGTVIVLENIYYDFNKSSIRSGAARELDALIRLMRKYPSMEIELVAHTDSRGTSEYNLNLSLRRAESAKKYLISRGIQNTRIKAFGYGESQLRNGCADGVPCVEEEHQFNRRTEVKIIKIDEPVKVEYGNKKPEVIDEE